MVIVCLFLPLSGIVISPEVSAGIKQSGLNFNKKLGEGGCRQGKKHCSGGIPDFVHVVFI